MSIIWAGADGEPRHAAFQIGERRFEIESPAFAEAVAAAHAAHERPRCLCRADGVAMYVARLGNGFIVKRLPTTGDQHAPDCASYEPPAELSGLGQVLGSAIREDPATGRTTLQLGFSMAKLGGRSTVPASGDARDSVTSDGTRLSLRGLLHYLWDQAELTRWRPAFAGRRTWATVRRHLLRAAEHVIVRGNALVDRLYVPEVFAVEQREAINARRAAQWTQVVAASPGKPQRLMLLIAEAKEIVPARYGYRAVVKHVPDQAFMLDEQLYRRLGRRFESELALWSAANDLHMVLVATFGVSDAGVPAIAELSLMPVTAQWLPIADSFEQQLLERLIRDERSFVKGLRYNMPTNRALASAILTDVGDSPVPLYVAPHGLNADVADATATADPPAWHWAAASEPMPALPARHPRAVPTRSGFPQPEHSI